MTIDRMGRTLLQNRWKGAIAAQGLWAATTVMLLVLEWLAVYAAGEAASWLIGLLLLVGDWFGLSPLKYGIAAFYWKGIYRKETTLTDSLREGYGIRYRQAIAWRWQYWLRSTGWALLCFLPAATLIGGAEYIRVYATDVSNDGVVFFYRLLITLSVPAGFIAHQICMLAYLPSLYLIISGMEVGQAFAWSRKLMRGTWNRTAWFFMGFGWWALLYVFLVPWLFLSPIWESAKAGLVYRRLQSEKTKKSGARHTEHLMGTYS